jgi:MAP/microtubule affinity-regulating kinase
MGTAISRWRNPGKRAALSCALIPLPHLKRRANEPTFSTYIEARKSHFQDESVERRSKSFKSYPILIKSSYTEWMAYSDDPVAESVGLTADVTNSATGDIVVNRDSKYSMLGEHVSPVSANVCPTASRSRSLKVWK